MRRMSDPGRGATLVEILIATFIFGLFLTAISALFVNGYRSYSTGSQEAFLFRGASIGFETMGSDLRQCEKIYMPAQATLQAGYSPVQGSGKPFVFVRMNTSGLKETLAYTENNAAHALIRLLYSPGFDPGNPASWIVAQSQTAAQSVQKLRFTWFQPSSSSPQFILISLTSYPDKGNFPLESKAELQGGF